MTCENAATCLFSASGCLLF